MADLRFDESQVAAILQRAVDLQATASPESTASLSLDELQRLAGEVGIAPEAVEQAAIELRHDSMEPAATVQGSSCLLEANAQGALTPEAWDDVVTQFRALCGRHGEGELEGGRAEWRCRSDSVGISLVATQRGNRVRLRLVGDTSNLTAVGWTLGSVAAILMGPLVLALAIRIGEGDALQWAAASMAVVLVATAQIIRVKVRRMRTLLGGMIRAAAIRIEGTE